MSKKILACALASSLALTTFASAFSDVTDDKSLEIVGELSALNVINGYEDGTFKPENPVTRAEFSKMIYVLMNEGIDDGAEDYKALDVFLDAEGHWAEGYINYCAEKGIINGISAEEFAPNDNITGVAAAKIALGYIGYNAEVEGLVGADWQANTIKLSSVNSLFDYFEGSTTDNATRQNAANVLYNAAHANKVMYVGGELTESSESGLEADFALATVNGIVSSTGLYGINGTTPKAGTVTIYDGSKNVSFETSKNLEKFLGANVTLYYNEDTNEAYGAYVSEGMTIETTFDSVSLDQNGDEIEINGRSYDVSENANCYIGEKSYPLLNVFTDKASGDYVRFVLDADGNVTYAFMNEVYFGEVLATYDDRFTTTIDGLQTIELDMFEEIPSLEAGDVIEVTYLPFYDKYEASKVTMVSGEVLAGRDGEIKIGENWYALHYKAPTGTKLPSLGGNATIYVSNGYIVASSEEVVLGENFATVINISSIKDADGNYRARLLLENGLEIAIDIDKALPGGSFVSYIEGEDVYKVTEISTSNLVGFEKYLDEDASFVASTDKLGSAFVADDAVIFVNANDDFSVMTGAAFKMLGADFGDSFVALATTDTGFDYISVAYVEGSEDLPEISGTTEFAFVFDDPYITEVDGQRVVNFPIFDESVEPITETIADTDVKTNDYITYIALEDGTFVGVSAVSTVKGAITAYDEASGTIKVANDETEYKVTDDTVILYVDFAENVGVSTGVIALADNDTSGNAINNIEFKASGTEIELLVVGVNNILEQ